MDNPSLACDSEEAEGIDPGLAALRGLLLSPEQRGLAQLDARTTALEQVRHDTAVRTERVSEVIAEAIQHRSDADDALGTVLRPTLETQFHASARDNGDFMAEALFPILGPAVRKLIADLLSPSTNGKPYQVEQLFLIDNPSGLPIAHVCLDDAPTQDADMVSGMLSALKSYVNEAFAANDHDGVDHLQVGDLSVWVEWGPQALLASVVRGVGPSALRSAMRTTLEQLHRVHADILDDYAGDSAGTEQIQESLQQLLADQSSDTPASGGLRPKLLAACVVSVLTLVCLLAYTVYDSLRWGRYLDTLAAQPGIVIIDEQRGLFGYRLTGLRDPLAADPRLALAGTTLDAARIAFQWSPVVTLHPDMVLQRAHRALDPPEGIQLAMRERTLIVTGRPSSAWLTEVERMAMAIPGIDWVHAPDANILWELPE